MFDGFSLRWFDIEPGVRLRVRVGGDGPPVVLLHGHPRTHTTWHAVAPLLLEAGHTVVCPDLRGYGRSTAPPPRVDHAQASKRAMAGDVLALMRRLGHERFAVVGHDRGSYVAFRLAMDHPEAVDRLAVLDSVPIGEALARADARFAAAWWHWFFFAQPDIPERVITADPQAWYRAGPERAAVMGEDNYADHLAAIGDPAVVRAMVEDYRAGLGVDRAADDADLAAGRRLVRPTLVAWSTGDDMVDLYGDVLAVWRPWAADLRGAAIDSGHHMAEEAPDQLARVLITFLDPAAATAPVGDPGNDPIPHGGRGPMEQPVIPEPDEKDWTWVLDQPCPECGYDASAVPAAELGDRIRATTPGWIAALAAPDAADRPDPRVWSVLEYGCHVRDVHVIFGRRLAAMLQEDDPQFDNWDQDATAVAERYWTQDPARVGDELAAAADGTAGRFDTVAADQWGRTGRRSNGSTFTVRTLGLYYLHDVVHHARDIARS